MPLESTATLPAEELDTILSRAAEIAAEYLRGHGDRSAVVNPCATPKQIREQITLMPGREGRSIEAVLDDVTRVLELSPRTGHAGWCNQLFGGYDLTGVVGEWMAAILNSTMATYEAAPVATIIEHAMIEKMCALAGFEPGEGIFTPGGSISNLMAVLAARLAADSDSNRTGLAGAKPMAMFTSTESHYSILRGAMIAGLGTDAARRVGIDHEGRMIPEALEAAIGEAIREGYRPIFVCATAGTTVYGAYDPIEPIADIAQRHGMWLHVDGAYGGSTLLSPTHRHLLSGIERADSLTWCPHKMMGLPLACSALLVRRDGWLAQCNTSGAEYLFHDQPNACYDMGEMSLQCGRRMDALKLWLTWQHYGDDGFAARIDQLFDLAQRFAAMVRERPGFRLVRDVSSCNVLFHCVPWSLRDAQPSPEQLDLATRTIRERVMAAGRVMINYAPVEGVAAFRMVLVNPRATDDDLRLYLDEIETAAAGL